MDLALHACQFVYNSLQKPYNALLALGIAFNNSLYSVSLREFALDDDLTIAIQQYLRDLIRREESQLLEHSLLAELFGGSCHLLAASAEGIQHCI